MSQQWDLLSSVDNVPATPFDIGAVVRIGANNSVGFDASNVFEKVFDSKYVTPSLLYNKVNVTISSHLGVADGFNCQSDVNSLSLFTLVGHYQSSLHQTMGEVCVITQSIKTWGEDEIGSSDSIHGVSQA